MCVNGTLTLNVSNTLVDGQRLELEERSLRAGEIQIMRRS